MMRPVVLARAAQGSGKLASVGERSSLLQLLTRLSTLLAYTTGRLYNEDMGKS